MASIAVVVSDIDRARAWYTEKLGLDVVADEGHWLGVGRKGRGAMLHLCGALAGWTPPLEPGNSGVLLLLNGEFRAACSELKAAGVEFSQPATKTKWGWVASIRDPDGNEHSLMPA
ncbi:MAG: VOC family protein [Thermoplasmata archaeon]